jgi:hypothetical protein
MEIFHFHMQDLCICFISTVQSTIGYISDVLLSLSTFDTLKGSM